MRSFTIILITLLFSFSCSSPNGFYKNNINNSHSSLWIEFKSNYLYEYTEFGHMTSYNKAIGKWKKNGDTIYLNESKPKLVKSIIVEISTKDKRYIQVKEDKETGYPGLLIGINNGIDTTYTDFDGIYYINQKIDTLKKIQIYSYQKNLVAEYDISSTDKSYKITLDLGNLPFSPYYSYNKKFLLKNENLYSLDSNNSVIINNYFIKTNSITKYVIY